MSEMNSYNSSNSKIISMESLVKEISTLISKVSGNQLGDKQAFMVETRIKKRMLELGLNSPEAYHAYLKTHKEKETSILVSLLTTHHTFFFREFIHFEFLKTYLPQLVQEMRKRNEKTIKIWSAACSRGQEVYSLAMFLSVHLPAIAPDFTFKILGTDIDTESVAMAKNGVYLRKEINEVPLSYMGNHWARGSGDISEYVKVKNSLRSFCEFKPLNLLFLQKELQGQKFDFIFCRNVFIYFSPQQVAEITRNIIQHLNSSGLFITGISESLNGLNLPLSIMGPSIYSHPKAPVLSKAQVTGLAPLNNSSDSSSGKSKETLVPEKSKVLQVLCVDDSPSILMLLKKILGPDTGFEVAAVAANGLEAAKLIKEKKFDVMTLDLHMPEQDGVTYLEKNFKKGHPPVMIISSVSRDDSDLALKALRLGAADYVEKPALANIEERGNEIRTKLKLAFTTAQSSSASKGISSLDQQFAKNVTISNCRIKIRIVLAGFSHQQQLTFLFKALAEAKKSQGDQPPTIVFFEGNKNFLEAFAKEMHIKSGAKVNHLSADWAKSHQGISSHALGFLQNNEIYLADFHENFDSVFQKGHSLRTSILVYGTPTMKAVNSLLKWDNAQLLLEEQKENDQKEYKQLQDVASDVVPGTSFPYMSSEFLGRS